MDISQVVVRDTVNFNFNYTIMILQPIQTFNSGGNPELSFARLSSVNVRITFVSNMLYAPLPVTGTMVIYDSNDVPVTQYAIDTNVPAQSSNVYVGQGQTIPKWAFTGQATIYANALTTGAQNGVPYCREVNTQFTITP